MKGFARNVRGGAGSGRARPSPRPAALRKAVAGAVETLEARSLFSAAFDVTGLTALREDPKYVDVDGSDVGVAVLDTGVFGEHPDLQQNVVGWYNAVSDPVDTPPSSEPASDAFDGDGHGTHVAGIATSSDPNVGVAYAAKLVAVKVLPDAGEPELGGDPIARGLRWVALHAQEFNVRVVNLSLGVPGNADSDALAAAFGRTEVGQAIDDLEALGITVVAAAGNSYAQYETTGAAFPAVASTLSVANTWADAGRPEDFGTPFGSSGDQFFAVETTAAPDRIAATSQRSTLANQVAAPGQDIYSLWNGTVGGSETDGSVGGDDGLHKVLSGTSMAAPFVSGLVALMQDAAHTFGGQYLTDPDQIRQIIQSTADTVTDADVPDNYRFDTVGGDLSNLPETGLTYKRVNVLRAVQKVYDLVTEGNPNPGGGGPEVKADTDSIRGRATLVPKLDATRQFTYTGRVGADGQVQVGADDVDLYRLDLTVRGNVTVALSLPTDVDPSALPATPTNTVLRLFDAAGTEVARAVGDAAAGGFATLATDPTLPLAAGLYYVGVSAADNVAYDVVGGGGAAAGQGEADYQMVVSLQNPDPNGVVQGAVPVDLTAPDDVLADPLGVGGGRQVTVSRSTGLLGSDLPVVGSPDRIVVSADVDMFRVVAPDDGVLHVLTQARSLYGAAGADTLVKVYDENLNLVASNDNRDATTTDSLAAAAVVRGGIYYVAVTAAGNASFDPQDPYGTRTPNSTPTDKSYDLVLWADNGDVDGTALTATPVAAGAPVAAAVGTDNGAAVGLGSAPSRDVDWYTMTPSADGLVRFDATGADGFVPALSLWQLDDASGQLIRVADDVRAAASLALRVSAGQQVFAAVTGAGNQGFNWFAVASGAGGAVGGYALSTTVEPPDRVKALTNDSVKNGSPASLVVGQTVSAEVGRDGAVVTGASDVDLYAFVAPGDGVYRFRTIAGAEDDADTALRLFDAKGRQLAANDNAADAVAASRVTATLKKGQTYYVGVCGSGESAFSYDPITGEGAGPGSTGTYALTAERLPPGSLAATFTSQKALKYKGLDGRKATIRLIGPGTGHLEIVGADPATGAAGSYSLTLDDTEAETVLRVSGTTTLGDVRVNGPMQAVRAGGATLTGNLNVEGTLGVLQLAGAAAGGQVGANLLGEAVVGGDFGADLAVSGDLGTFAVKGNLTGGTWDVAGGVQTLSARNAVAAWTGNFGGDVGTVTLKRLAGSLSAGSIGSLVVSGDVAGGRVATVFGGIDLLDVGGLAGATVRSAGDVGRAWVANGAVDSTLYAGVDDAVTALPADGTAFVAETTIVSLYVGKGPFSNTRIAAARVERATLPASVTTPPAPLADGAPAPAGEPFGIATTDLGSLWFGNKLVYRGGQTPAVPTPVGDFVVPPVPGGTVPRRRRRDGHGLTTARE